MRQKGIAYIVYYSHFFFRVSHRHCVIRSYFIINCTRFILVCVFYFGDLENSYRIFTFCAKTTKIDNKFALKFLLDYEIRWKKQKTLVKREIYIFLHTLPRNRTTPRVCLCLFSHICISSYFYQSDAPCACVCG